MFKSTNTYHYAIVACKFVKAGRVGLPLFVRSTLLIGAAKDVEIVVIKVVACEDVGNEF